MANSNTHTPTSPVPVTFRLSDDEREQFRQIAAHNHRSMAGQLRAWIDAELRLMEEAA